MGKKRNMTHYGNAHSSRDPRRHVTSKQYNSRGKVRRGKTQHHYSNGRGKNKGLFAILFGD